MQRRRVDLRTYGGRLEWKIVSASSSRMQGRALGRFQSKQSHTMGGYGGGRGGAWTPRCWLMGYVSVLWGREQTDGSWASGQSRVRGGKVTTVLAVLGVLLLLVFLVAVVVVVVRAYPWAAECRKGVWLWTSVVYCSEFIPNRSRKEAPQILWSCSRPHLCHELCRAGD